MRLCEESAEESQASLKGYIQQIFDGLQKFYPDEHFLLELLACGKVDEFRELAEGSPEIVEHLLGYNILVKRGSDFDLCYEIIRRVILSRVPAEDAGSMEAMRAEISKRRNKIEEEIRVALFHWSRNLTYSEWEDACRKCIPKRVERDGVPAKNIVFSKMNSPLFLMELLQFIKFSRMAGADVDRARRVAEAVDVVNQHRVDAHAKAITRGQFEKCGAALDLLENVFVPPD